jgi:hypothetical protein
LIESELFEEWLISEKIIKNCPIKIKTPIISSKTLLVINSKVFVSR